MPRYRIVVRSNSLARLEHSILLWNLHRRRMAESSIGRLRRSVYNQTYAVTICLRNVKQRNATQRLSLHTCYPYICSGTGIMGAIS